MRRVWSFFQKNETLSFSPNYHGTFQSTRRKSVRGELYVYIPFSRSDQKKVLKEPLSRSETLVLEDPPTEITTLHIQTWIYYDPDSIFKPGFSEKIEMKATVDPAEIRTHEVILESTDLWFSSTFSKFLPTPQLRFTLPPIRNPEDLYEISGTYQTKYPSDQGVFTLKYLKEIAS